MGTGTYTAMVMRAADSRGWFSSASGASAYTVANIRLDVRPVEIAGPLYK